MVVEMSRGDLLKELRKFANGLNVGVRRDWEGCVCIKGNYLEGFGLNNWKNRVPITKMGKIAGRGGWGRELRVQI